MFLEAIEYGRRLKILTLCFHRKWCQLSRQATDHLLQSLTQIRTSVRIEIDISLLASTEVDYLIAGVQRLKIDLGPTEVYINVRLSIMLPTANRNLTS
jgi:hypothetical protein